MKRILALGLVAASAILAQTASPIRQNAGFRERIVPRNDDGSSPLQQLGFTINFFGQIRTGVFVNNNGNVTFDSALSTYTPFGLEGTRREIIAAFFADVDTRPAGSNVVTFGNDTINGRTAFGVNYLNVGYFSQRTDKLNSFQLILIDRSDVGAGNFDIEFNYERIRWETGDASGGVNGLGGVPVSVGWSNGTGAPGTSFELEGSLVSGALLDGGFRSLTRNRLNTTVQGRYVFRARNGEILQPLGIGTGCPLPPGTVGSAYRVPMTMTGEGSNPRWAIVLDDGNVLPAGLSFANGVMSGTPTAAGSAEFTLRLTATTEDGDQTLSRRCSISVGLPRLTITTACPLPAGSVGQPYSRSLQAAGGRGVNRWSLLEGESLPAGLTLSADGAITGIPQAEGNYTFAFGATSDTAQPAQKFCSMSVAAPRLELTGAACTLPAATVGVPYTRALEVRGGTPPYAWTSSVPLPAGMSLTAAGQVVGLPTEAGDTAFEAIARDASGRTVRQNCTLTVANPEFNVSTGCPLPMGMTGVPYDIQFTATGGRAPYTWSLLGPLPAGLTLSSNGRVTGRPMAGGPSSFRIIAADSLGRQTAKACSIPVLRAPFALNGCPVSNITAGVSFTRTLSGVGGASPYVYLLEGSLPQGVYLDTFGNVTGTVARPGNYNFDVKLVDSDGFTTVQPCGLVVAPSPLSLGASCPLPDARVGENYSRSLSVTGGSSPYRFTLLGELPSGLRLSESGTVAGVPLTAGEAQFALRVTDSGNRQLTLPCAVNVEQPNLPNLRINDIPTEFAPASAGPRITVSLSRAYNLPVRGLLTLTVTPETGERDSNIDRADPRVRFSNGLMIFPFTLNPGQTSTSVNVVTTGTVASRMVVSLSDVRIGNTEVPNTASPRVFRVPWSVPTITDACYAVTPEGINVRVTGLSTTRSISKATLTYTTAFAPQTSIASDVSISSSDFFLTDESVRTGGAFTLVLPFATTDAPTAASIVLQNAVGPTASRTLSRCQ